MSQERESLSRFIQARGPQIIGRTMGQVGFKIQVLVGATMLCVSGAMVTAASLGGPFELGFAALGPGIAGVVNLIVGVTMRMRFAPASVVQVDYSPEARDLVRHLCRQFSAWGPSAAANGFARHARHAARHEHFGMRDFGSKLPPPTDEALDFLDRAAKAYQRIAAVLSINKQQPNIVKMGTRVAITAEEAMADIFHQTAVLCRYPESGPSVRRPVVAEIETLEEIALRLEEMSSELPQPHGPNRTSVEDLLTDLRLEALSRAELRPTDDSDSRSQRNG